MRPVKLIFSSVIVLLGLFSSSIVLSAQVQLLVVGLTDEAWYPYVLDISNQQPAKIANFSQISGITNPAHVTLQKNSEALLFQAEDGRFGKFSIVAKDTTWLDFKSNKSFMQLRASSSTVYLVEMMDGKSAETQIWEFDSDMQDASEPFYQASSQLHPYAMNEHLFYGHVSCRLACSPVVQDLWVYSKSSKTARQLTRLNAITSLHSADSANGYLSSNANGYYNLAKLDLIDESVTWLTRGELTDTHPAISDNGDLYFIRKDLSGSHLMVITKEELMKKDGSQEDGAYKAIEVELPAEIEKIRYLEG